MLGSSPRGSRRFRGKRVESNFLILVELVMQREQEEQLRVIEVAQAEILALKEENSKLVAAESEFDFPLPFLFLLML
jgi:hypothetical protein